MKLRLFVLLSVLTVMLAPAAQAIVWSDDFGTKTWTNLGTPENPDWKISLEYRWKAAWGVANSSDPLEIEATPGSLLDPLAVQDIFNDTEYWWTDWHLTLVNATLIADSVEVYNYDAASPAWEVEYLPGLTGFNAHVVSGNDTQVDPLETLYVKFNYVANGPGSVYFQQYPTNTWPIPEPASMMALAMGVATLGLRLKRRAK